MNTLLKELQKFSKENWWVFILLIIALSIVYITGKWNLLEILILFFANFVWNLCIMVMQANYTAKNNKIWAMYHLSATLVFIAISLYGLFELNQSQYIIFQVAYTLAAIKAFTFYNFKKDLTFLNEKTFIPLNIILFIIFITVFEWASFWILQAIWFGLITTWLVSIIDKNRYWLNVFWIWALVGGSLWWVILTFNTGNLDGIALWYFTLTLTVFIYYLKLLKKYL